LTQDGIARHEPSENAPENLTELNSSLG